MKPLPLLLATALLFPAAAVCANRSHADPPEKSAAPANPRKIPLLTTQLFESGELNLADCSAASLERFLQDLNRRKDYDYSQHNGQPGPHSAYLWDWVQKVTAELQNRGYSLDDNGNLFRPDASAVPLR